MIYVMCPFDVSASVQCATRLDCIALNTKLYVRPHVVVMHLFYNVTFVYRLETYALVPYIHTLKYMPPGFLSYGNKIGGR
jgi:hypothetical protein